MSLDAMLRSSPLWRPCAFPPIPASLAITCFTEDVQHIKDILNERKYVSCNCFYLIDNEEYVAEHHSLPFKSTKESIPLKNIDAIGSCLDSDILFFSKHFDYFKLIRGTEKIHAYGFRSFFIFMPLPYNFGITTTHLPLYLHQNRAALEQAFALLEDEESKRVFASRVRALLTGNVGYLRLSPYLEYFHPQVQPTAGDVVLDGGISANIVAQVRFCRSIGQEGRLYGFEPDPIGFVKAHDLMRARGDTGNCTLIPLGLWSRKATLHFALDGQASHVAQGDEDVVVPCEMTTIDDFVAENRLGKVDCIKLDVEGAEAEALRGGLKTIVKFKPKMAISLYHKPEDLYELPILAQAILPDARFYLGHHHAALHETILYVLPR